MTILNRKRIGKFYVDEHLILNEPQILEDLFRQVIILRAENLFHRQAIEYIAICTEFCEVEPYKDPPEYLVVFSNDGVSFERK